MSLLWTMTHAERRRFEKAGKIIKELIRKADAKVRRKGRK